MSGNDLFLAFYIGTPVALMIATFLGVGAYLRWAEKHAPPPSHGAE